MRKKLRIPLAIVVCLLLFCLGFLTAELTAPSPSLLFDQLPWEKAISSPASESSTITIVYEGTYPGFADTPISKEQAASGRRTMNALRGQKYARVSPLRKPKRGGIAIYELTGCTPECLAYWDGNYLWVPEEYNGPWSGYAPTSAAELDNALRTAKNNK